MGSTNARWDKIDQRRDPVTLRQSPGDVQWPLVTIRVLCTGCANMSKCTCVLLTPNPRGEPAGSARLFLSGCVYSVLSSAGDLRKGPREPARDAQ